jgi:hypothetical protein
MDLYPERLADQLRFVQKGGLYIEAGLTNLAFDTIGHQLYDKSTGQIHITGISG